MEKITNASCSPIRQANSESPSQIVYDEAAIAASNIPQTDRHKSLSPEPKVVLVFVYYSLSFEI